MRMPWYAEMRWLIAQTLIGWSLNLVAREVRAETLEAFVQLVHSMEPRAEFKTVAMQRRV